LYILLVVVFLAASFAINGWLLHNTHSSCHNERGFLAFTLVAGIAFLFMSCMWQPCALATGRD
jgi:hypothetical protein